MRILVGCERSGVVRRAFRKLGHSAWSCDLAESEDHSGYWHIRADIRDVLGDQERFGSWDMLIAHPPCTHLTNARNRWMPERVCSEEALELVRFILDAPVPKICVENPPGAISTRIRRPNQYAQPWWFGDPYSKPTGLWLKGLEPLRPEVWIRPDGVVPWTRARRDPVARSRTFPGIARAMAEQWG